MFKGKVWKDGSFWVVEVPALDVTTQGRTKGEAYAMIADAVDGLIDNKRFKADTIVLTNNEFILLGNDHKLLFGLLLKQQRGKHGLTIAEVAKRIGCSMTTYSQYEQGRNLPGIKMIEKFIEAMGGTLFVCDVVEEKRVA